MDIAGSLGLPLAWKRGAVDTMIEVDKSSCDLKPEISDLRDCLVPDMKFDIEKDRPRRQLDYTFIRGDLKDLPVEQMLAILQFCREMMRPLVGGCFTKEDLKAIATKTKFSTFFEIYRGKGGW